MLQLFDGLNVLRRAFETRGSGEAVRECLGKHRSFLKGDVTVWCWDAPNGSATRRALFPDYKTKRTAPVTSFFETVTWVKDLLKHTNTFQVEVSGYEADDLIAHFALSTQERVHIHSNDRDFTQLLVHPHITCDTAPKGDLKAEFVRLYKTVVGDPSDNIPGVPGFGARTWEQFTLAGELPFLKQIVEQQIRGGTLTSKDHERLKKSFAPNRSIQFLAEKREELAILWTIVGFLPLPAPAVSANIKTGQENLQAISKSLREFML